jgi:hypothetical protein
VLRYSGLSATGADGRQLRSWLVLRGSRVLVRVDVRGARYPVRVDPFIEQGAPLIGEGENGEGFFGTRVALSGDGDTALAGAPEDALGTGAAWVFARSGSTWAEQGPKLVGEAHSLSGSGVALSADGDTALVGAPGVAAAFVYVRSGSTWTRSARLAASEVKSRFGYSVALSADGNTALIGAPGTGEALIYTRSGSTWTQQTPKLTGVGVDGSPAEFGEAVALSADGSTALVGGPKAAGFGAAWVFARSGSTWARQGEVLAGFAEEIEGGFGTSVALSANGDTALIGAPGEEAAWTFTRAGTAWTQHGRFSAAGIEVEDLSSPAMFGSSVALSPNAGLALVGAAADAGGAGAAWVFTPSGSSWVQQGGKLTGAGRRGSAAFGSGIALSADGSTALIGGPGNGKNVGAGWVFAVNGSAAAPPFTPAQIATSLRTQLEPPNRRTAVASLRKGSFDLPFTPPGAGEAKVRWFASGKGARKAGRAGRVLLASGAAGFATLVPSHIRLGLTSGGRRLLSHTAKIDITAEGSFTPATGATVKATHVFSVHT